MHHCSLQDIDGMSGKITRRPEKLTGYRRTRRDMEETDRIHMKPLRYGRHFWDTGETHLQDTGKTDGIREKLTGYWRNLWDTGELCMILEKLT
mgnify:FL=1